MKSKYGKSNLEIVRNYMNGERPFVTVGYDQNTALGERKEGEEWVDSEGKRWVKKSGYKQRVTIKAQRVLEMRCAICNADMKWGSRLDDKIYPKTGRCYDCNISFEAELKLLNLYKDYEKFKLISNEKNFLQDLKSKMDDSLKYLSGIDPKLQFFNEDGSNEFWIDDTARRAELIEELTKDLSTVNDKIQLAETELSQCKYNPNTQDVIYAKLQAKK